MLGDGHFALGQKADAVDAPKGALAGNIELADGIDLVAEKLDAHRGFGVGREEIDESAAESEIAYFADHRNARIAQTQKAPDQVVEINLVAGLERDTAFAQIRRRHCRFHQGPDGANHRLEGTVGQPGHGADAAAHDLPHRRPKIVGQYLPGREMANSLGGHQKRQVIVNIAGRLRVGSDDENRLLQVLNEIANQKRWRGAGQTGNGGRARGSQRRSQTLKGQRLPP